MDNEIVDEIVDIDVFCISVDRIVPRHGSATVEYILHLREPALDRLTLYWIEVEAVGVFEVDERVVLAGDVVALAGTVGRGIEYAIGTGRVEVLRRGRRVVLRTGKKESPAGRKPVDGDTKSATTPPVIPAPATSASTPNTAWKS